MGAPIRVTVGPLATASATKVAASQTAAGAQALVLNGTGADAVANNICASQSAAGAGNLTINGTLARTTNGTGATVAAYANMPNLRRVYITSAGNDSGVTFTVSGTIFSITGPVSVVETVTGANTNVVSTTKYFNTVTQVAISGASAAAVTVGTNGVATLDTARRIIITSGGDDSGITFTLTGTDWYGEPITETKAGANGVATALLDYATVTGITTSAAAASTITVGTNTTAGSPWARFDDLAAHSQVSIQVDVSGTLSTGATVQQSLNDPDYVTNTVQPNTFNYTQATMNWLPHPDSNLVNVLSGSVQGNYGYAPEFARLVITTTGSASAVATFKQAYLA